MEKSICTYTYHDIKKLTDDEIIKLINGKYDPFISEFRGKQNQHPLVAIHDGYRIYENYDDMNCGFCGNIITANNGYWDRKQMMHNEKGTKLCHRCFLKFLIFIEDNLLIRVSLEKIYEKENMDNKELSA